MKTTSNKTSKSVNSISFEIITECRRNWKEASIFRVLDFLNKQSKLLEAAKITKALTIDDMKALCPEYMAKKKFNKKGIEQKRMYSPDPFILAIRKLYGV